MNIILKIMLRQYRRKLEKKKREYLLFCRGDKWLREEGYMQSCIDCLTKGIKANISAIDVLLNAETQTTVKKPEA